MGAVSTISSKGQITLPLEVRQRLGVGEGDRITFEFDGERTTVRPLRSQEDPFAKWVGVAKGSFKNDEELLAWHREMRGGDEDRS